jgi:hypothetical protein
MQTWSPGRQAPATGKHELMSGPATGCGFLSRFRFLDAQVEQSCLRRSVFAQFRHFVHTAFGGLLLFTLVSAFQFFPLFLLPRLFFLAFRKR